ncbi:hypothetical protein J4218_00250 [Candidatus Pacearchaeota archaeon]|nr:hypothetical protein [Candidatus Pacearchaeota archaeon]
MESAIIGLGVIAIAFILQLVYSWKGKKDIQPKFLIVYAIGTALLIIDCYLNDLRWTGIFNTIVLMISLILLIRISAKGQEKFIKKIRRR